MTQDTKPEIIVRPRKESDLEALADLLARQQPETHYPIEWPFPVPLREFIVRDTELHAWVAELDGEVVGHVSVTRVTGGIDSTMSPEWTRAHGVDESELRCISVFFTDVSKTGIGLGRRLHDVAAAQALKEGYPVLDVVARHEGPVRFYANRGWKTVHTMDASWSPPGNPIPVKLMILPREA
ncbi:hypothetical protein Q8F55_000629 [Vanrija albida]|uniref:N-acetyltransferase domain-containing protein n=1 Tax=Vanrija albida TaxID=181172 RepID=A0ABR3QDZ5_9TREE